MSTHFDLLNTRIAARHEDLRNSWPRFQSALNTAKERLEYTTELMTISLDRQAISQELIGLYKIKHALTRDPAILISLDEQQSAVTDSLETLITTLREIGAAPSA